MVCLRDEKGGIRRNRGIGPGRGIKVHGVKHLRFLFGGAPFGPRNAILTGGCSEGPTSMGRKLAPVQEGVGRVPGSAQATPRTEQTGTPAYHGAPAATPPALQMRRRPFRSRRRMKLCKDELVREIARVCEVSLKDARTILDAMLDSMVSALQKGERIELRTFGTFYPRKRSARPGRNPRTGAPVDVGPKTVPRFRPAQDLLNVLNSETIIAGGSEGAAIEDSGRQSESEAAAGA